MPAQRLHGDRPLARVQRRVVRVCGPDPVVDEQRPDEALRDQARVVAEGCEELAEPVGVTRSRRHPLHLRLQLLWCDAEQPELFESVARARSSSTFRRRPRREHRLQRGFGPGCSRARSVGPGDLFDRPARFDALLEIQRAGRAASEADMAPAHDTTAVPRFSSTCAWSAPRGGRCRRRTTDPERARDLNLLGGYAGRRLLPFALA